MPIVVTLSIPPAITMFTMEMRDAMLMQKKKIMMLSSKVAVRGDNSCC